MSTGKHTPGPWKRGKYGGVYPVAGGPAITLMDHKDGSRRANADANELLIVAVPDLLTALELTLPVLQQIVKDDSENYAARNCIKWARAAIAKVSGDA